MNSPFGNKTYEDIRKITLANLSRRYREAQSSDLEDAVAYAMADLFDYWMDNPNSITEDTKRNFAYAMWRCQRFASVALAKQLGDTLRETPTDREDFARFDADLLAVPDIASDICDEDEIERVGKLIDGLSPASNLRNHLQGILAGLSASQEANDLGISRQAVHKRRKRAIEACRVATTGVGISR